MSDVFAWEDPPPRQVVRIANDDDRWFPPSCREALRANPGRWGRIARDAGKWVPSQLRKRMPEFEFVMRRDRESTTPGRRFVLYARFRDEATERAFSQVRRYNGLDRSAPEGARNANEGLTADLSEQEGAGPQC